MGFRLKRKGANEGSETAEQGVETAGGAHADLQAKLQYQFKDVSLLELALTHRSVFSKSGQSDYERLEFLGDAVLDLAVAHLLIDRYPQAKEGDLSKMRAALVNTNSLAALAKKIGLRDHIRLSKGEISSGGADRPSILADVCEALIGAIYKEAGFEAAFICIAELMGQELVEVTPRDPKTELQEALHSVGSGVPTYKLECVEGPEHAPSFVSVVEVDGRIVGRGRGTTKKSSQQEAAAQALESLLAERAEKQSA